MSPRSLTQAQIQLLLRHAVLAVALLSYVCDPVDIVWRFAVGSTRPRVYEHLGFGLAAVLLLGAALLASGQSTASPRGRRPRHSAATQSMLFACAIAALLPWAGALILVCGEAARLFFSAKNADALVRRSPAVYWSALFAMTLFSITLQDRIADVLFGLTLLLALALDLRRPSGPAAG